MNIENYELIKFNGVPDGNGDIFVYDSIPTTPDSAPITDSFADDAKVVGKITSIRKTADALIGTITLTDEEIISKLRNPQKFVGSMGMMPTGEVGDSIIRGYHLMKGAIIDTPSQDLKPILPKEGSVNE